MQAPELQQRTDVHSARDMGWAAGRMLYSAPILQAVWAAAASRAGWCLPAVCSLAQTAQAAAESLQIDTAASSHQLQLPGADPDASCWPQLSSAPSSAADEPVGLLATLLQPLWQLLPWAAAPQLPVECLRLAGTSLTRLDWTISSNSSPRSLSPLQAALPALSPGLRHLGLHCVDTGSGAASLAALAPVMQALTTLTSLSLQGFCVSTSSSQQLPASLQELAVGAPLPRFAQRQQDSTPKQGSRSQPLQLQHLSNLRRLQLHSLAASDVVPAGVTALRVGSCSPLPLIRLRQLRQLSIEADVPAAVPLLLTAHTSQLEDLQLSCSGNQLIPVSFKHLAALPLTKLHVLCELPDGCLPLLGHCSSLTSLQLQLHDVDDPTQQQLAGQLAHLTALRDLSLTLRAPTEPGLYDIAAVAVGALGAAAMEKEAAGAGDRCAC